MTLNTNTEILKKSIKSIKPKKQQEINKDLRVLSLFSGCGGLDLGLEGGFKVVEESVNENFLKDQIVSKKNGWCLLKPTRFKTVFANDIRKSAKILWQHNFGKNFAVEDDVYKVESIVDLVKRHWNGEKNVFPKNIDIVTGGFPCQDFSLAGKRLGFKSTKNHFGENKATNEPTVESRGQLYIWMREVIDIVQPKVFIAENVKGLATLGNVAEIIKKDFESIGNSGYIVIDPQILHAGRYGVPQSRERIFFIGFRKDLLTKEALKNLQKNVIPDEFNPYPKQTHYLKGDLVDTSVIKHTTLKSAFKQLLEPNKTKDLSQKSYSQCKWYGKHCQGNTEVKLDYIGPTIRSEHHGNIEFRRLAPKNGGSYIKEFNSGLEQRRLTVRECARIQTFPDEFDFVLNADSGRVSTSEAYKLIGNAVPPLLGYHLANRLQALWPKLFK